jgi:hypothetical protein
MDATQSQPVRSYIPAALILALVGWGGLVYLWLFTVPTVGPRWLFFFLSVLALTGTVLPVIAFLNKRFPSQPPPTAGVVLRQAIWVGIYLPTLAWLQIGRVLSVALVLLLALGFVLVEWLLRLREKSQWKPEAKE